MRIIFSLMLLGQTFSVMYKKPKVMEFEDIYNLKLVTF